jgi:hypothetical protein
MVPLKTNQIKEEILEDNTLTEVILMTSILKETSTANFKKKFEEGLTPEALRGALYKKVDDLWGK